MKNYFLLFLSFLWLTSVGLHAQTSYYVKQNGSGIAGHSWEDAFPLLQNALSVAVSGDQIFVAAGTYNPTARAGNGETDRDKAFVLISGVKIYGGFSGNEPNIDAQVLAARDFVANATILSGDIGSIGNNSDNCYHVIIAANIPTNSGTRLDGFTITGGYADGSVGSNILVNGIGVYRKEGSGIVNYNSSPELYNLMIRENTTTTGGGGVYNWSGSSPKLTNVTIFGNAAKDGAGIANRNNSSPTLTNVAIFGNKATAGGGGVYNEDSSSPVLINVTIGGNMAVTGGGIYNSASSPRLTNCIVFGNSSGVSNNTGNSTNSNPSYSYSLVQGLSASAGGGMLDGATNPLFINPKTPDLTTAGNYRLQRTSPAIDAGSNSALSSDITSDRDGKVRIINGRIDLGAYEVQSTTVPTALYVKTDGIGYGTSWDDALSILDVALNLARIGSIDTVFVAKGTYKPQNIAGNGDQNRDRAFVLVSGVKLYGGFDGTEQNINAGVLASRNFIANPTILSGDIGVVGNNNDNCYHVVVGTNIAANSGTRLDGFTITGGNADDNINSNITVNGTGVYRKEGGGIVNYYSSPELANLIVNGNNTGTMGGGVYNWSGSSPSLTNVVISGNTASSGAGIAIRNQSSPTLVNVTISGNKATTNGGGVYIDQQSSPTIINSIVQNNSSGVYNDNSTPNYSYSLVQGLAVGSGTGMFDGATDPKFMNPQSPGLSVLGNYRLKIMSAAIDAGNNSAIPTGITTDLDGRRRLVNNKVDMGAYEFDMPALYVKMNATGFGTSWNDALGSLDAALSLTRILQIDTIYVAAGTYKPSVIAGGGTNERDKTFVLVEGVKIYGGFAGYEQNIDEDVLSARDFVANTTILSGDIGIEGVQTDNCLHIVVGAGIAADSGAVLDGFTITNGIAGDESRLYTVINNKAVTVKNGGGILLTQASPDLINLTILKNGANDGGGIYITNSSPKISNSIIAQNTAAGSGGILIDNNSQPVFTNVLITENSATLFRGGGMTIAANSSPKLINMVISGNSGGIDGGGIYSLSSSPILTNVLISGNTAGDGGGMHNSSSSPILTNVTISGNYSGGGGGIYNLASAPVLINSIVSGNSSGVYNKVANGVPNSTPSYTYSLVEGMYPDGIGNIDGSKAANDPLFLNPQTPGLSTAGDYRLLTESPAIDAGNNNGLPSAITTDLDGNDRVIGGVVDMGAYEWQGGESNLLPLSNVISSTKWTLPATATGESIKIYQKTNATWVEMPGVVSDGSEVTITNAIGRPCEPLKAKYMAADGTTINKAGIFRIPNMVSGTSTINRAAGTIVDAVCAVCDLVALDGAKLSTEANLTNQAFHNLYLLPGSKLEAVVGSTWNVNDVHFRAAKEGTAYYNYPTAAMKLDGTLAVGGTLNYERTLDDQRWYFISFPYPVAVADIHAMSGTLGSLGVDWFLKYFDGAQRAQNRTDSGNWQHFTGTTLAANEGYIIGLNDGQPETQFAFPLTTASNALSVEGDVALSIASHKKDDNTSDPQHDNWNVKGFPYFSKMGGGSNLNGFTFVVPDNGATNTFSYLDLSELSSPVLNPFIAYFIQSEDNGSTINFGTANRSFVPSAMSVLRSNTRIYYRTETGTDYMNLKLDDSEDVGYHFGADLVKWAGYGTPKPQVYMSQGGNDLAVNVVDYASAVSIPVTVYNRSAGTATFSAVQQDSGSELVALLLTDLTSGVSTDLLAGDYSYAATAGLDATRFMLSAQRLPTGTTVIPNGDSSTDVEITATDGRLRIEHLKSGAALRIYDTLGRNVTNRTATGDVMVIDHLPTGVYIIQIIHGQQSKGFKIVL